jgi:hypothetical protein
MRHQRGFILPGLPNPYFLLAAGIAIAVSFGLGYWRGWSSGMENYYEFKGRVEAANEQVKDENERKLADATAVAKRATDGWETALRELDQRGRVIRVQPARCPKVPAVPNAGGQAHVAAEERAADPAGNETAISVEQCETVANNAVEDAAKVLWLQDFIVKQHEATK